MEVTFGQARAFLDTLIGMNPVGVNSDGDTVEASKSPVVHAHLCAALGNDRVPHIDYPISRHYADRYLPTIEYLEAVAARLREAIAKP